MVNRSSKHIHTISSHLRGPDGITYQVQIHGLERTDHTWEGWIEFHPLDPSLPILRTEQETSQPSRVTLDYWAGGLEPIYLQGALRRAIDAAGATGRGQSPAR